MSLIDDLNKKSYYDYMILFLITLIVSANVYLNILSFYNPKSFGNALVFLIIDPVFLVLLDIAYKKLILRKTIVLPKTAIISGLFVAGIMDPTAPVYVHLIAGAIAILSKHLIRNKMRNIFNPAGFGITLTGLVFTYLLKMPVAGSWWLATTLLAIPFGLYISYRLQKLPMSIAFLVVYSLTAVLVRNFPLAQVLEPSFLSGYFFFSCFMLLEPRTSTYSFKPMVIFGVLVAILSGVMPLFVPTIEYTLVGLLLMNLFTDVLEKKFPDQ
ncbi:RnfABCDGE type electron transport complex subunit D [Candidatus Micrarchaeota archaeon]|nr:RnfABCDGE type electron transport complex subunit D [Candidatus Micrarchaeota archaeon]